MKHYDYLIVGAGLFGAVFAYKARQQGKKCLVIVRRPHLGGNIYCEKIEDINVHKYGAHIFHTSNKEVWISSIPLWSSTDTPTLPWPIIGKSFITFRLTRKYILPDVGSNNPGRSSCQAERTEG